MLATNSAPMVSVVIPTYRHEEFILEAIDSVFAQTYSHYEVIVVNDGSPDNTGERLAPLAHAGRIRYIEQSNQGQASARNRAIAESTGKYIALLDDDDVWLSDKLEWQVDYLESHTDAVAVVGDVETMDVHGGNGQPARIAEARLPLELFFSANPILSPGQSLIRREAFNKAGGFDSGIWGVDDLDLWLRLSNIGALAVCNRVALRYRRHDSNASRDTYRMFQNAIKAFDKNLPMLAPTARRRMRHRSTCWLYWSFGWRILAQPDGQVVGKNETRAALLFFVKRALQDQKFARLFLYDMGWRRFGYLRPLWRLFARQREPG